jgi:brefeldin A-inhibited guanine nucleotide-exchange protein
MQADLAAQRHEVTRFKEAGEGPSQPIGFPHRITEQARIASHSFTSGGAQSRSAGHFSDHDEHLYFWMPLLIGLTELSFDPREVIRNSALDVLFDILREHGVCFSADFWDKVFERMLLPIFDSVQVEDIDFASFPGSEEAIPDRWLYDTCSHCLHHLIDLMVKFYPQVHDQLPKVRSICRRSKSDDHG